MPGSPQANSGTDLPIPSYMLSYLGLRVRPQLSVPDGEECLPRTSTPVTHTHRLGDSTASSPAGMMFLARQNIREKAGHPRDEMESVCRCAQACVCMEGHVCMGTWVCKGMCGGEDVRESLWVCTGRRVCIQTNASTRRYVTGPKACMWARRQETDVDRCVCREEDADRCTGAVHGCTPDPAHVLVSHASSSRT